MIDFQKTEPNRKPNSLTAVNRKGHFLKFLSEIWDKIRGNSTISVGFVKKNPKTFSDLSKIIAYLWSEHFQAVFQKCWILPKKMFYYG